MEIIIDIYKPNILYNINSEMLENITEAKIKIDFLKQKNGFKE
jgi:hypothetical protein